MDPAGHPLKDLPNPAAQLRTTFEASREAVQRAHERAEAASERARRMRAEVRKRRDANARTGDDQGALSLAEEESARAIREIERFVAIVSHELRQPLNAAIVAIALLEANPGVAERAGAVLKRQLVHMSTLLDDLLDISRLSLHTLRLSRGPVDLRMVMRESVDTVEAAAERAGVHLYVDLPPESVGVSADVGRLHQVFSNLLTNAVRHTPHGGSVNVSMAVDGSIASITIADTGQGIAPADLSNLFEPFWRGGDSSTEGFGIGLALVRGIVELHGGSIGAFSEGRGMGARFCLTLPLAESD